MYRDSISVVIATAPIHDPLGILCHIFLLHFAICLKFCTTTIPFPFPVVMASGDVEMAEATSVKDEPMESVEASESVHSLRWEQDCYE